jgi:small conductance mechanosensitive channel
MWATIIDSFWQIMYETGQGIARWASAHIPTILTIIIGTYLLRKFGGNVLMQVIRRTVRPDLFPTKSDREKRIKTLQSLIDATLRVGSMIIALLLIADNLNIRMSSLLASAGIVGVAVGFGAQSLIKDFVSGLFIITENQYRVGDVVDLNETSGTVEAITIRTTILRDDDGYIHHVPNGSITSTTNKTMDYSRVNLHLLVRVDSDIDKLEHIINHTGEELLSDAKFGKMIHEPPRFMRIRTVTGNGIDVLITGKTAPSKQWAVRGEYYRRLLKNLKNSGIELATTPTTIL